MKTSRAFILPSLAAIALIVVAVLAYQIWENQNSFRGSEIAPSPQAAAIDLLRVDGSPYSLAAQQGRVVLIYFGFTNCPDFCPGTLAKFQQVQRRLGEQAEQVDFLFVTTDPERDTPEATAAYATYYGPAFIGLSGSEDELQPIWQGYFVGRQVVPMPESALGYTVNHSTRVYVIDLHGNLRLTFPFEMKADDMAHDVRLLLKEQ